MNFTLCFCKMDASLIRKLKRVLFAKRILDAKEDPDPQPDSIETKAEKVEKGKEESPRIRHQSIEAYGL